jgi:hypothetical protein
LNGRRAVPDQIVITNVPPYDGRYDFDLEQRELSTREWGWIKRLAGYLPLELNDEQKWGDPELVTVFAVIALRRAGRIEAREVPRVFELLADAPFDGAAIQYETEPVEEDDAGPPASSSNGSTAASGPSLSESSETSPPSPPASGTPASATSPSAPSTLAT